MRPLPLIVGLGLSTCLAATQVATLHAQLFSFTKEQLIAYTAENPFERFDDGRPKVPDALIERAKDLSAEEILAVLPNQGYRNQYEDGFEVLHPGAKMVSVVSSPRTASEIKVLTASGLPTISPITFLPGWDLSGPLPPRRWSQASRR